MKQVTPTGMVDRARNDPATTDSNKTKIEAPTNAADIRGIPAKKPLEFTATCAIARFGRVLEVKRSKLIEVFLKAGATIHLLSA